MHKQGSIEFPYIDSGSQGHIILTVSDLKIDCVLHIPSSVPSFHTTTYDHATIFLLKSGPLHFEQGRHKLPMPTPTASIKTSPPCMQHGMIAGVNMSSALSRGICMAAGGCAGIGDAAGQCQAGGSLGNEHIPSPGQHAAAGL